ncbi:MULTISPECIES: enoyl-CoA hydratase-related protein [unclassified Bacillus (in: firmicutes)]|uniref:enoyl-CoA hydratase-related protein n=1 Tax=unclassified Bacillus (in: firmicutes) TaxID=185979 RepID=UPI001BEA6571|nr:MULTISPECIES: enoyl-CoA hydratase-related protein [unclassified Bacillus (in: firmicutes)]MBT2614728.1 enoyl-CoA hydratase/isomerase family protein [Bacillus sp. ISL-78]MBT2631974.1 enoyl-CoA hydratase/isomerase family protein [Bacillus sp. ISL-101]MBT2715708.1 enoyl-CoA hydratase/isomerase family protein [Bacillus sp. ISL-57]
MSKVIYKVINQIGYITVNRPDVLNCFDYETLCELQEVIDAVYYDDDIRVVIFTGAGEKAFSAGADLKERKSLNDAEVRRNVKAIRDVFNSIAGLPQPTMAAVNGYALGGGFEWLLSCDFAIAAEGVSLGLTETSWAIIPGAGGTQRLPRLIGEMKAKELIFTAKKLTAEEACQLGILLKVVPRDRLMSACEELAANIMKNGPIAVKQAKYAIDQGMNTDLQTGMAIEGKAYELTIPTQDRSEALLAFSERRKARFTGK